LLIRGLDDLQLQLKIAVTEKPAAPKRADLPAHGRLRRSDRGAPIHGL
jgi:hypothetical protein